MICIIAGNYLEAERYANAQLLDDNEWFYPSDETDLLSRQAFHVLVVGTAGQNVPSSYFERILRIAKQRGKMNRITKNL